MTTSRRFVVAHSCGRVRIKNGVREMTLIDAMVAILRDAREPLHYQEITRRVLQSANWRTSGKTPDATVSAALTVDVKRHGSAALFARVAPGVYTLNQQQGYVPITTASPAVDRTVIQPIPAVTASKASAKLSFTDAAERVLEQQMNRKPMHYRALTEEVLRLGLIQTKGLTPAASLFAQILTASKRAQRRGDPPRFVLHGKGFIGLAKWAGQGLAFQIEQHNDSVRRKLHAQLLRMNPTDFEALVVELLAELGFEDVTLTPPSNDGGIDVRGTLVVGDVIRTRMAVQVKRWRANVQQPTVQQVRGSLGTHEQGLIITTSDFSKGAVTEANRADAVPVGLMDGDKLVDLLIENDIGVHRQRLELIELGDDAVLSDGREQPPNS